MYEGHSYMYAHICFNFKNDFSVQLVKSLHKCFCFFSVVFVISLACIEKLVNSFAMASEE